MGKVKAMLAVVVVSLLAGLGAATNDGLVSIPTVRGGVKNMCVGLEGAVEHFRQYLRIPTVHPSPDYAPALRFILSLAQSLSLHPTRVVELVPGKGIALLTWQGSDPSLPSILLNSHMDVVPAKKEDWKHDPFEAVMEENGDIYGRGSQDTKCIGIQYMEAIRNLKRLAKEGEVTSINAAYFKAGQVTSAGVIMNVQPSEAEAGFDIRIHPGTDTECLETLISEQWAPQSRNMSYKFVTKSPKSGRTPADDTSPWWGLLVDAVHKAGGKLADPETRQSSTDGRFLRNEGILTYGFSPMANTPIRQHGFNEFLNAEEFCKGITVYEEIIKAYASYAGGNPTK